MTEQRGEPQGFDRSEPNVRFIALFGAGTLVLLVLIIFGLQAYFDRALEQQVYIKVLAPPSQALIDLRTREDGELHSYRYVDQGKGIVQVPIERAMELLVSENAQGKVKYPQKPAPVEVQGGQNVTK